MNGQTNAARNGRFPLTGALAGAIATFVFTIVHDLFISNIWPMFVMMVVTGALCGACISWSYGLLVKRPSLHSWLVYNLIYDGMLILLGIVSVLLFEPVTTIAALSASGDLPMDLLGQAMPMAAVFTLLMSVVITLGYGFSWQKFGVVLLTSVLLVLLLGHNMFIIGLVDIPRGSLYLVLEMFGLIILLNVVYAAVFVLFERKNLFISNEAERGVRQFY
jgi:hypothetical protein